MNDCMDRNKQVTDQSKLCEDTTLSMWSTASSPTWHTADIVKPDLQRSPVSVV